MFDTGLADEDFCYLTTTGRLSGEPREIEIWFGLSADGATVYMLSGGRDRSNWVRNLIADPAVTVRIAGQTESGRARLVAPDTDEDAAARRELAKKYAHEGSTWQRTALPVAVDV